MTMCMDGCKPEIHRLLTSKFRGPEVLRRWPGLGERQRPLCRCTKTRSRLRLILLGRPRVRTRRCSQVIGIRRQSFVPLFDLFNSLAEVSRGLRDRRIAPPATNYPIMLEQLSRRDTKIRVFLKTLHQKVPGSLRRVRTVKGAHVMYNTSHELARVLVTYRRYAFR